jgi:hypothetical protein
MSGSRLVPGLLAAVVLLIACPASAQLVWTIPGIVNAGGLNNTRFVSDFTATNPGTAAAQMTIDFFPSSTPNPKSVTLSPGQTIVYRNIVDSLFGTSGAGALSISSDQPLLLRARTYNTAASGTYGVALPVAPSDRLLSPGDVADSLWLTQDASGSSGYRTNIAVVFPDAGGGAATVRIFDADGNARGSKDYSLDAAGLQQFSVGSIAGAVATGRAQIVVTRGHAAGYSVVVDNVTGDSALFSFEDLPAGIQDVLVNGVARANGRNGAFFRTDGRFYNPTGQDATVQVSFHANANANPSPPSASFAVPAGMIRDVVDVLDSLLSLPVGSAGALRFRSDRPIAILCRTSNVDPTGARPGTYGAQQKPLPLLSFLNSADAGAAVTGIRQDASYRTNVGFAAGADGAQYALTLQDASGGTVATSSASLGAFGWSQPGVQDLFPSASIPANATLKVRVTGGSLDVFDSSIDNLSGDPVVTPIAPLPITIPSSATIGPAGGSVASADGRLTLRVPAGALATPASVSFTTDAANDAPQGSGPSYTLSPGDLTFSKPATLVFRYGRDDLFGTAAGALGIAFQSGSTWYVVRGGSIHATAHTLTVPIGSTSPAVTTASVALRAGPLTPRRFTAFKSIQIFPKKAAVLTEGSLNLLVLDVGDSSAEPPWLEGVAPDGVSPLSPVDPANITYKWLLNGTSSENAANGLLVQNGANGAKYLAPSCAPRQNPVIIGVDLGLRSNPNAHFSKAVFCSVRVLPRDWQFAAALDEIYACPYWFADDHVIYGATRKFSLDEQLNVANVQDAVFHKIFVGSPKACDSNDVDLVHKAGDNLSFALRGSYDVEKDWFELFVDWSIPGSLGYNYNVLGSDGTKFPSEFQAGPKLEIGLGYVLEDGDHLVNTLPGLLDFKLDLYLDHVTPACPSSWM